MPTPTRVRDRFNPNVQWFHPPIDIRTRAPELDSLQVTVEGTRGIAPELWGMHLAMVLERIWRTQVGQAVISCVRKRATIYPTVGRAQTFPDPYNDSPIGAEEVMMPDEANARAETTGTNALTVIDLNSQVRQRDGAETWSPDVSLLHELVHAVNITWGNYRAWGNGSADAEWRGAPSPEEEFAWVIDTMYRSERGMWLRERYSSDEMLPPGTPSLGASRITSEVVSRCNWRVRPLAARLERIDARTCPFNPFRDYAQLPPGARP